MTASRQVASDCLVCPACASDDYHRRQHCRADNLDPLVGNEAETIYEPHTGGDKEKAEIGYKKLRGAIDAPDVEYTRA